MRFDYYEIKPAVDHDGSVVSFYGKEMPHPVTGDMGSYLPETAQEAAEAYCRKHGLDPSEEVFWTLYGRHWNNAGKVFLSTAIGDFDTFEAAYEVLDAIITPLAEVRDMLEEAGSGKLYPKTEDLLRVQHVACKAANTLDDIINQCTNEDRI